MVIISKIFWGALTLYRSAQLRKPTKFWKLFSNHPIIASSKVPVFFLLSAFNLWPVVGLDTCCRWAPKREKKKISYYTAHHTNEAILPIYIIHIANLHTATSIDIIRKMVNPAIYNSEKNNKLWWKIVIAKTWLQQRSALKLTYNIFIIQLESTGTSRDTWSGWALSCAERDVVNQFHQSIPRSPGPRVAHCYAIYICYLEKQPPSTGPA